MAKVTGNCWSKSFLPGSWHLTDTVVTFCSISGHIFSWPWTWDATVVIPAGLGWWALQHTELLSPTHLLWVAPLTPLLEVCSCLLGWFWTVSSVGSFFILLSERLLNAVYFMLRTDAVQAGMFITCVSLKRCFHFWWQELSRWLCQSVRCLLHWDVLLCPSSSQFLTPSCVTSWGVCSAVTESWYLVYPLPTVGHATPVGLSCTSSWSPVHLCSISSHLWNSPLLRILLQYCGKLRVMEGTPYKAVYHGRYPCCLPPSLLLDCVKLLCCLRLALLFSFSRSCCCFVISVLGSYLFLNVTFWMRCWGSRLSLVFLQTYFWSQWLSTHFCVFIVCFQ